MVEDLKTQGKLQGSQRHARQPFEACFKQITAPVTSNAYKREGGNLIDVGEGVKHAGRAVIPAVPR